MVTEGACLWLVISWCLFPLVRGSLFTWPIIKNDHVALAESVAILTRNQLSKASSTVVVLERSWKEGMRHHHSSILDYILTNLEGSMAVQLYNRRSDNQLWEYHIFVVDGIDSFADIGWHFSKTEFERSFHFLILLTEFNLEFMKTLRDIFISCHHLQVLNANVVLEHPVLGVCMYKYSVFSKDKCNEVQPHLHHCFKDGIDMLGEVFPQKLVNFWGCPLRITARHNPPNLSFLGNKSNLLPETTWNSLSGVEGDLLKLVSKTLNFTIHLVSIPEERIQYRNSTIYGCFAELREGNADIAVGGFGSSDPMRLLLTPSVVILQSPIVFIVRQRMQISSVSRLLWPFQSDVWILLAFCLLVGSLVLHFLRLTNQEVRNFIVGYQNQAPVINFIGVLLGYSMTHLPVRNFARYLLTLWLLVSLVIRSAYQGSLYDSFRTDRNARPPQDYDELIKWDYQLFVSTFFKGYEVFPINRSIIIDTGHINRIKKVEENEGRYATVALKNNFMSYLEENYRKGSKVVMVSEPVFLHSAVFFFRKNSIYVSSINKKLRLLTYSGITNLKYTKNVKDYDLFRSSKMDSVTPEAIKFFRLKGVYLIWGQMLILGLVVFVLELLSDRFELLRLLLNCLS